MSNLVARPWGTLATQGGLGTAYYFWCPACAKPHQYVVKNDGTGWKFDGNMEQPTFTPSFREFMPLDGGGQRTLCHLFLKRGQIEYCGDSPHSLAGQKVPMVPIPDTWDV
jgi:hypothetical protein